MTATGKKRNMRLVSVVMGEETSEKRSSDTMAMLDYGFNMYNLDMIVEKNKSLGKAKVNLGVIEQTDIIAKDNITVLNNSQKAKRNITYEMKIDNIVAPVKVGDTVGKISVYEDNKFSYDVKLTVIEDIKKASIFKILLRNLRDVFGVNL